MGGLARERRSSRCGRDLLPNGAGPFYRGGAAGISLRMEVEQAYGAQVVGHLRPADEALFEFVLMKVRGRKRLNQNQQRRDEKRRALPWCGKPRFCLEQHRVAPSRPEILSDRPSQGEIGLSGATASRSSPVQCYSTRAAFMIVPPESVSKTKCTGSLFRA